MTPPPVLVEFPADDPDRARHFWSELLGEALATRTAEQGQGWQAARGDAAIGVHERGRGPGDTGALPYFAVSDLPAALERVAALGGTVIHPGERWAVCRDSEGSPFALSGAAATDRSGPRLLGTLRSKDGTGIVRMEDRIAASVEDVWSAVTTPRRLAAWLGEIGGDLRVGGDFRARFSASGWEGTGRVHVCDPPHHLLVVTQEADGANEGPVELTLQSDGGHTRLTWEEHVPSELLPDYGAGIQIHVEHLSAYLVRRELPDADARWGELIEGYRALPVDAG